MGQRSIRFPDELEARLKAAAEREGRSFSNFVVRALETALRSGEVWVGDPPQSPGATEHAQQSARPKTTPQSPRALEQIRQSLTNGWGACPKATCPKKGLLGERCPDHKLKFKEPL